MDYEIPRDAVAEAIVNAIAHRDYSDDASAQVMLFSDRLEIWNPGALPSTLSFDALRRAHPSIPRNPLLAEPLFLARYIEKAGTGTLDMIALCEQAGLPGPTFRQDSGQFIQTLIRPVASEVTPEVEHTAPQATQEVTPEVTGEVAGEVTGEVTGEAAALVRCLSSPMTRSELQAALALKSQANFRDRYLLPALKLGVIEMTRPEKPSSSKQAYRLTPFGLRLWKRNSNG